MLLLITLFSVAGTIISTTLIIRMIASSCWKLTLRKLNLPLYEFTPMEVVARGYYLCFSPELRCQPAEHSRSLEKKLNVIHYLANQCKTKHDRSGFLVDLHQIPGQPASLFVHVAGTFEELDDKTREF
jgi:hypothetical protein